MARKGREPEPPPACYAMVQPGLEEVAEEEITRELRGRVKRSTPGVIVFRVPEIDRALLRLRTVEDVFLLAWGTDQLTYRAEDLDRIRRWTARETDWARLLRLHHEVHPKPRGRPTYRLVPQMTGEHGYRRIDAGKALAQGLAGKLPASWKPAEENAAVEVWLTIHEATAVCGLRLSDKTMRHRTYKREHVPASLRPTLAAAMVRLAEFGPTHTVLDPMCGAGTILAEALAYSGLRGWERGRARDGGESMAAAEGPGPRFLGGDSDRGALRAAEANLRRLGSVELTLWDATQLPLPAADVDRIISNPPFGKQLSRPEDIGPLYCRALAEYNRVLRPGGRAVLLVADLGSLREAARAVGWQAARQVQVRVLGQRATISVWRKEG